MATSIIQAMKDKELFGQWFRDKTWANWKVFLKALFAHKLTQKELDTFHRFTHREPPPRRCTEAWLAVGRRGGKSRIAALLAEFLAWKLQCHEAWRGLQALFTR